MKTPTLLLFLITLAVAAVTAAEKEQAGPNGGRLLKTEPRTEFYVNDDRKVEITFVNEALQPIDPGERTVRIIAMAPSGRTALAMEPSKTGFISKEALPEGDGYTIVTQIFETPDARPQNFRVTYQTYICGGCDLQEYACTCGH